MAGLGGLPGLLRGLMEENFFADCETHESMKDIFCLHCHIGICHKCVSNHPSHHFIQVRRRRGGAVIKLDDLRVLIDCSLIRTYSTNVGEVLYLRPQPRVNVKKMTMNICSFCGINLYYDYPYCSLTCKVEHMRREGNDISSLLFRSDASQFVLTESENLQTNVYVQPDDEAFDGDNNQIQPDLAPIDFVAGEGSSSGWSLSEIVESCKKKQ